MVTSVFDNTYAHCPHCLHRFRISHPELPTGKKYTKGGNFHILTWLHQSSMKLKQFLAFVVQIPNFASPLQTKEIDAPLHGADVYVCAAAGMTFPTIFFVLDAFSKRCKVWRRELPNRDHTPSFVRGDQFWCCMPQSVKLITTLENSGYARSGEDSGKPF